MEVPVYLIAVVGAILFVLGIVLGSAMQGRLAQRDARELISQTARRRKNMSGSEEGIARELDLVIASAARKFLPKEERTAWLALVGEEDPR